MNVSLKTSRLILEGEPVSGYICLFPQYFVLGLLCRGEYDALSVSVSTARGIRKLGTRSFSYKV